MRGPGGRGAAGLRRLSLGSSRCQPRARRSQAPRQGQLQPGHAWPSAEREASTEESFPASLEMNICLSLMEATGACSQAFMASAAIC